MYHKLRLSIQERIKAWLDLCDFSLKLLEDNMDKKRVELKLKRMREDHLKTDYSVLSGLSRIK